MADNMRGWLWFINPWTGCYLLVVRGCLGCLISWHWGGVMKAGLTHTLIVSGTKLVREQLLDYGASALARTGVVHNVGLHCKLLVIETHHKGIPIHRFCLPPAHWFFFY